MITDALVSVGLAATVADLYLFGRRFGPRLWWAWLCHRTRVDLRSLRNP